MGLMHEIDYGTKPIRAVKLVSVRNVKLANLRRGMMELDVPDQLPGIQGHGPSDWQRDYQAHSVAARRRIAAQAAE